MTLESILDAIGLNAVASPWWQFPAVALAVAVLVGIVDGLRNLPSAFRSGLRQRQQREPLHDLERPLGSAAYAFEQPVWPALPATHLAEGPPSPPALLEYRPELPPSSDSSQAKT